MPPTPPMPPTPQDPSTPSTPEERLARALGAHLATPPDPVLRAVQVAATARVARDASPTGRAGPAAAATPTSSARTERAERRRTGGGAMWPRALVPVAGLAAAALAAVVVLPRVVGPPPLAVDAPAAMRADAGGVTPEAAAPAAPDAAASADAAPDALTIAPVDPSVPVVVDVVLADGLIRPAARAPGYLTVAPDDLAAPVRRMAAVLGLPEPGPVEWFPDGLVAEGADGASLVVGPTGEWSYSGPLDDVLGAAPTVPGTVPSRADAEARALALLSELGLDGARVVRVDLGASGAGVDVSVPIAGAPDGYGLPGGTFHDARGRLAYAFGSFGRSERVGTYRTVGLDVAQLRLRALLVAGPAVTLPEGAVDAPGTPGGSGAAAPHGVVVRMVAVELVGGLAFGLDGAPLLVPHYRFTAEDGTTHDVLAVDERHLGG